MSRAIRILFIVLLAVIGQTNLAQYLRIAGVVPDLMVVFLVLLTGYTGAYGGFCAGSVMSMFYDASVGYVLAINLISYTFIGWTAPLLRDTLRKKLKKVKHKSYLEMMLICFALSLVREVMYVGYLFLIGAEQSLVTVLRVVFCAAYNSVLILPCSLAIRFVMTRHWQTRKKKGDDLWEDTAS